MGSGPRNPFLADSGYAVGHGRCDQQDNTPGRGPEGPTEVLADGDIQYARLGPGHFGGLISGRYPDGRRVVWSNGRQTIAKLDYDTLEVLATLPVGTEPVTDRAELDALEAGLDDLDGDDAVAHAIDIAFRFMTGLDGVYSLLDCDHTLFLGRKDHAAPTSRPTLTIRPAPSSSGTAGTGPRASRAPSWASTSPSTDGW